MKRPVTEQDQLDRVRRLVGLYERRIITGTSLINDVAECSTPANADEIMKLLPEKIRERFIEWIRRLPHPSSKEMVVWPLPCDVTMSFKEWLKKHETDVNH